MQGHKNPYKPTAKQYSFTPAKIQQMGLEDLKNSENLMPSTISKEVDLNANGETYKPKELTQYKRRSVLPGIRNLNIRDTWQLQNKAAVAGMELDKNIMEGTAPIFDYPLMDFSDENGTFQER